jgi:hypothetical protein
MLKLKYRCPRVTHHHEDAMRLIRLALLVSVFALPSVATAQAMDTLAVGERVRVRVAATRGYTNLFFGSISAISADTLVLDIPGGKGTIILPRVAISEVAKTAGRESRFRNLPMALPLIASTALLAALPPLHGGPHANALNNQRYVLIAISTLPLVSMFMRTPPEHWEPTTRWLEGRAP